MQCGRHRHIEWCRAQVGLMRCVSSHTETHQYVVMIHEWYTVETRLSVFCNVKARFQHVVQGAWRIIKFSLYIVIESAWELEGMAVSVFSCVPHATQNVIVFAWHRFAHVWDRSPDDIIYSQRICVHHHSQYTGHDQQPFDRLAKFIFFPLFFFIFCFCCCSHSGVAHRPTIEIKSEREKKNLKGILKMSIVINESWRIETRHNIWCKLQNGGKNVLKIKQTFAFRTSSMSHYFHYLASRPSFVVYAIGKYCDLCQTTLQWEHICQRKSMWRLFRCH